MIVEEREYARLLGYPWGTLLEGDVRGRAEEAAAWFEAHGRPRVYCVTTPAPGNFGIPNSEIPAHVTITAITAGSEADTEVERLWEAGCVDEAYFLDRYAVAVVEKLAADLGADRRPGTGGIPFEEQWTLFEYIKPLNPEIEMLPSGMLKPKNSLLAVVPFDAETLPNPCVRCGMPDCSYRRTTA